ncbi:acyl-CoA Delta(11) desaturase [Drosophila tropicalis]|uniref:acyl-CoA Delta(11) desaturase n=1 Tax=Drosophila tropicalis TaxID=46794 RepID=UPI0035ABD1F8
MPPYSQTKSIEKWETTGVLFEKDAETIDGRLNKDITKLKTAGKRKYDYIWLNIFLLSYIYALSGYGLWLFFTAAKWQTMIFTVFGVIANYVASLAGPHRLYSHRSFKANVPLQFIILLLHSTAFQDSAFDWARDHRVHHKYTETDADPYNSQRGWFFSHVGWLCTKKHPEVLAKGKEIDVSDLTSNALLMFQKKHFSIIMPTFAYVLPTLMPMYFWNEGLNVSFHVATILRLFLELNFTFLINSSAHIYGNRPYDKTINPTNEPILMWLHLGEGYHNYHHTFPWDYKNAEQGKYAYDFTTYFIKLFSHIGWATDLKTVSTDMVRKRVKRTGDGTHPIWGWGDKDQTNEDRKEAVIVN